MKNGKIKNILLLLMVVFVGVAFKGCSCSFEPTPEDIPVRGLTISSEKKDVSVGTSFFIEYSVVPLESKVLGVVIVSSDNEVVEPSVNDTNENVAKIEFEAKRVGESVITFSTKDGEFEKSCKVTVYKPTQLKAPENIKFDGNKIVWDTVQDVQGNDPLAEEKYNLQIVSSGTEKNITCYENEFDGGKDFSFEPDVRYDITLMSMGDNVRNLNSEASISYTFYILSTPSYTISNGVVDWSEHYTAGEEKTMPNYFIITYNNTGDYEVVTNNNDILNNNYNLLNNHATDYEVTVQALYLDLSLEDAKHYISENTNNVLSGEVGGIEYIASKVSKTKIVDLVKDAGNVQLINSDTSAITIDGISVPGAFSQSLLKWTSESNYREKIKYSVIFSKNDNIYEIALDEKVQQLAFTKELIDDVLLSKLKVSMQSPTFDIQLKPHIVNSADKEHLVLPQELEKHAFSYYPINASDIDLQFNEESGEITLNALPQFKNFQFVLIDKVQDHAIIKMAKDEKLILADDLKGMLGRFDIYINASGDDSTLNIVALDLQTQIQKPKIQNAEIIAENDNYLLTWKSSIFVSSFLITGINDEDITVHATDGYYNEATNKWLYPLNHMNVGENLLTITALGSNQDWQVGSDKVEIVVVQLPTVNFKQSGWAVAWELAHDLGKYADRIDSFAVTLTNQSGDVVFIDDNYSKNLRSLDLKAFEAGEYQISLTINSSLKNENSNVFALPASGVNIGEFIKLNNIEIRVEDGELVWDRTVEGVKNNNPHAISDEYIIYVNGNHQPASYETSGDGVVTARFSTPTVITGEIYVIISRSTAISDGKNFLYSNESNKITAQSINVKNFKKVGDFFEFEPTEIVAGVDKATNYQIIGTHQSDDGYKYTLNVVANNEYFKDGKYTIPVGELVRKEGEYIFTVTSKGQYDSSVFYVGNHLGEEFKMVQLSDPSSSQVIVQDGTLLLEKYQPASSSPNDKPINLVLTFYTGLEVYNTPITYAYSSLQFDINGQLALMIPSNFFISVGSYTIKLKYTGNDSSVLDSQEIMVNGGEPISKLARTKLYIEDGRLKWEAVNNATSYRVYLDGSPNYTNATDTILDTSNWRAGVTTVEVQAYGANYLAGDKSEVFLANKLNTVVLRLTEKDGFKNIVWDSLPEGVSSYEIYKGSDLIHTLAANSASWRVSTNEIEGDQTYYLVAKGSMDTRSSLDKLSGYLTSNNTSKVTIKFISPTRRLTMRQGVVNWEVVAGATNYNIDVYLNDGSKERIGWAVTNQNTFDLNTMNLTAGNYLVEVTIAGLEPTSTNILSTHEDVPQQSLVVLNISKIDNYFMYSNIRVEDGVFAYDITNEYLNKYLNILRQENNNDARYDQITIQTIRDILVGVNVSQEIRQILYPLTNFNIYVDKDKSGSYVKITNQVPTDYRTSGNDITLYYQVSGGAGSYGVIFEPMGNVSSINYEIAYAVMTSGGYGSIFAIKPAAPTTPINVQEKSIIDGKLVWELASFTGDFVVEFVDSSGSKITSTVTVASEFDATNPWQAKKVNNQIMLDLQALAMSGNISIAMGYSINIYAKGTPNSQGVAGNVYLKGETASVEDRFEMLSIPLDLSVENGGITWRLVDRALSYSLNFYLHNGEDYVLLENREITTDENYYLLQNNLDLPSGNYKIEVRALGNNENILHSMIATTYAVKLGTVDGVYVKDGRFAFDQVIYHETDASGNILDAQVAENYIITISERRGGNITKYTELLPGDTLTKDGATYLFELDKEYSRLGSDYNITVYTKGNNGFLLSGDIVSSEFYTRSTAPVLFELDESGLINWERTDDHFVVYVNDEIVEFYEDGKSSKYTKNNYFDINNYVKETHSNGFNATYTIHVRALHANVEDRGEQAIHTPLIRSPKSELYRTFVMETPQFMLDKGDIRWQGSVYEDLKENISDAYLIVKGLFMVAGSSESTTLKIKMSADITLFKNAVFNASLQTSGGQSYYYVDTNHSSTSGVDVYMIDNNSYQIAVQYIGSLGTMKAGEHEINYISSNIHLVNNFQPYSRPSQLKSIAGETIDQDASNYLIWEHVHSGAIYQINAYSTTGIFVNSYNVANVNILSTGEHAGKVYYAVDDIIAHFADNGYGESVVYEIITIGTDWHGDGDEGKNLSSVPSEKLQVDYPQAPESFGYDGKGTVTWQNQTTGDVVIEINYKVSNIYDISNYINNHDEIISRTIDGDYATDVIELKNMVRGQNNYYQLKYLTSEIKYISIKAVAGGLNSRRLELKSGLGGNLSSSDTKFDLFNGGDGSIEAPFEIFNQTQLKNINYYLHSNFILTKEIVLVGTWVPIGSRASTVGTVFGGATGKASEFAGVFDGDNFTISNIMLEGEVDRARRYAGMFYATKEHATIKNLTLDFAVAHQIIATSTDLVIGGLIAKENHGDINNVTIKGEIQANGSGGNYGTYIGGLVFENYGVISFSTAQIKISEITNAQANVGGLVVENYGTITTSKVESSTLSGTMVGGIASINFKEITRSFFNGNIKINSVNANDNAYLGGIAAMADVKDGLLTSNINGSYAILNIEVTGVKSGNTAYVGGLVGMSTNASNSLTVCYVAVQGVTQSGNMGTITRGSVYGSNTASSTQNVYVLNAGGLAFVGSGSSSGIGQASSTTVVNNHSTIFKQGDNYPKLFWQN